MRWRSQFWAIRKYEPDNTQRLRESALAERLSHDVYHIDFMRQAMKGFKFYDAVVCLKKLGAALPARTA